MESVPMKSISYWIAIVGAVVIGMMFTWWLRTDIIRNTNLYQVYREVVVVSQEVKAANKRLAAVETRLASVEKKLASAK